MILVIGATGRVGGQVVEQLVAGGFDARALTRRPDTTLAGVEVVTGDLTRPDSLAASLRGVTAVFLVWTAPATTAPAVIELLAARVPRVVLLSSPHQTPHPFFQQPNPMATLHAEVERLLAAARVRTTILRPGMFASNTTAWWAPQIRAGDVVRWPYGSVETAPIDERDLAAVAVQALTDERHAGGDYVLTGPEGISHAGQVRAIGEAIGRELRFVEWTPDEFRHAWAAVPPTIVEMLLDAWKAASGHPAYVTSTVGDILGRPARTFRQWAADHAQAFR